MFLRTRRRVRPLAAVFRGGAISGHLSWHGSVRSRRLRARLRTPPGAGLQRPAECAGRGRWPHPSGLRRRLLAAAHCLRRALAGACVGAGALPVDWKPATMTDAAVRADLTQTLDRLRAFAAEVAFDLKLLVDVLTELRDLLVGEIFDLGVGIEAQRRGDLARRRLADAVDVRQPDLEPLLVRKIYSGDACQLVLLPVMLSSLWVASTKPEAALVRGQGRMPWRGRGWALAPRDRGPEADMYCWEEH